MSKKIDGIIIRSFKADDYESVISLWKRVNLPYKPLGRDQKDRILKEISRPETAFLVAAVEAQLIGTILATHDGRKGWINRLAVLPEYRRSGIARSLLKEAEEFMKHEGIDIIGCLIEDHNRESMEFFRAHGYRDHPYLLYFTKKKDVLT